MGGEPAPAPASGPRTRPAWWVLSRDGHKWATPDRVTLGAVKDLPGACLLLSALVLFGAACRKEGGAPASTGGATVDPSAIRVVVAYGSEKKAWLEEQIAAFNRSSPKLGSGVAFVIEGKAMGSGEAMQDILDGRLKAAVFSPASGAYLALLNQDWMARAGNTKPLAAAGESVVISPLVIALWRPMAEALGWPKRAIGWADIIKIGRDPTGWGGKGRPEWGRFKLGHTHPEFSTSGLLAVLAEAYAGAGKTRGLDGKDLANKKTRDFVSAVEAAVVHYGKSTGFFADKMLARGPSYLSAAVLYENLVIESYGRVTKDFPLVAIYPREGTFWSDHPYSILTGAPWLNPALREGAEAFLAFLKARPAQERALALGFRPADPAIPMGAPIDEAHGVDPKQPQTLLEVPDAPTLGGLLGLWRSTKKPSDVTLVFDKSGSMEGPALAQAKSGAIAFLRGLQPRDSVSVVFFDAQVYPVLGPRTGDLQRELGARIQQTMASGGTALYDAVLAAYDSMDGRARAEPGRIHALVVMTDGKDEHSRATLEAVKQKLRREEEAPVKVFTIAYGDGAQSEPLAAIAEAGRGSLSRGSVTDIVQVYRDIASFF
jgi:Ca-activated chloride channel homolog